MQKLKLPSPLIVWSGDGLHVYWPLELSLDRGTWDRYARGLKALCIKYGLHVDHNRTTDISSVLRTPGTHHRKRQAKEVLCGSIVGPFPISAFPIVVEDPSSRTKAHISKQSNLPAPFLLPLPDYLRPFHTAGSWKPLFSILIAAEILDRHPAQLPQSIVDSWQNSATSKGKSPNPMVRRPRRAGVLCGRGSARARLVPGDPRYTARETQERLDRARQFGPTTCKRFRDLSPAGCRRCPWSRRINSPIALGGPLIAQGRRR